MEKKHFAYVFLGLSLISIVIGILALFKSPQDALSSDKSYNSKIFLNKYIAYLELNGPITGAEDGFIVPKNDTAPAVKRALEDIQEDTKVKGVLLRINSPGGTVGESQEIYNLLLNIRGQKPVVVAMGDVAASGGYYIASAADKIVANHGTITGSIGVIINSLDLSEFMNQKLGIKANVVKSGEFKDIASPNRKMTPKERILLQEMIDNVYHQFVADIKRGRIQFKSIEKPVLTEETLAQYADGRIFTGEQAQKLGFVDEVGDLTAAKTCIQKLTKKRFRDVRGDLPIEPYQSDSSFDQLFKGFLSSSVQQGKVNLYSNLPLSYQYPNIPLLVME